MMLSRNSAGCNEQDRVRRKESIQLQIEKGWETLGIYTVTSLPDTEIKLPALWESKLAASFLI